MYELEKSTICFVWEYPFIWTFVMIHYIFGVHVLRYITIWYTVLEKHWNSILKSCLLSKFLLDLVHQLKDRFFSSISSK